MPGTSFAAELRWMSKKPLNTILKLLVLKNRSDDLGARLNSFVFQDSVKAIAYN